MFIILLEFSDNKEQASQFMEGHQQWLKQGFDDGIFLMAGSLRPNLGGAILAHDISQEELQIRVNGDPFVSEGVVSTKTIEITPSRVDKRLEFLLG